MSETALSDLPKGFAETRDQLHQLAFFAVSPTRYKTEGRMGLRHHPGGFGTPAFGGRIVRVEADLIIDVSPDMAASRKITTIRDSVEFLGTDYDVDWFPDFHDPLEPMDPDRPLTIDPSSTLALGRWFRFGWAVLESLKAHAVDGDDPSAIQIWPEHFDAATELGDLDQGQRASFGASPGDLAHPEPYVYVSAWSGIDRSDPYWNDQAFNGSSLSYRDLVESGDAHGTALDFLLRGHEALHAR